jgi:hypothetical protein
MLFCLQALQPPSLLAQLNFSKKTSVANLTGASFLAFWLLDPTKTKRLMQQKNNNIFNYLRNFTLFYSILHIPGHK